MTHEVSSTSLRST